MKNKHMDMTKNTTKLQRTRENDTEKHETKQIENENTMKN
jgi:hypothetical protein